MLVTKRFIRLLGEFSTMASVLNDGLSRVRMSPRKEIVSLIIAGV